MAEAQLTNQLTRIDSMTNVELRAELKRRGCPTSGNKKDLLAKLRAALQKEYEQAALDTASNTSTIDSITVDSRNNSMTGLQQSPVVPFDVNRPLLNTSTASSNNYMTPHGGSPMAYQQPMQTGEVPLTYHNLQMHDQTTGQYPPVYNLTMHQNIHPNNAPMIPVPQQLTLSPAEHHPIYEASVQPQQINPTSRTRGRASADASHAASVSPAVSTPIATPEKKTRSRSKNASMDSRPAEIPVQPPIPAAVEIPSTEPLIHQPTPVVEPVVPADSNVDHSSAINNTIEVNPFVSKSNDEDHHHHHQTEREDDKEKEERGNSRSPSVDSSSAKSESVIKEIPLSGERNRLSRSKSPKSRWHHSPSPQDPHLPPLTNDDDDHRSATPNNDDEQKTIHDTPVAENTVPPTETPAAPDHAAPTNDSDASKKDDEQPEKAAPQQQLKPSRSQGSTSGSLMKGLNRSAAGNRMNLSSDVLKTLIPDISLAPESVIETELEAANDDEPNDDQGNHSPNRPVLETSIDSGAGLLSDSMNTGDGTEQKQQRNRTVLIDLAVDASSLNDDLMGTNNEPKKKPAAITPKVPTRMASFESKPLLDGKTNALMTDEPVRVKDATVAREPASQIIYIRGLTRPFTPNQLKELLGRYGTLVDGEFWLDKIKSQCFVMYNTSEEAQNAREALDGCRWPSSNPKSLSVRFARQEEFEYTKTHGALPEQMSNDGAEVINNRSVQEKPAAPGKLIAPTHGRRSVSPTDEEKMNNNTAKKLRPMNNNDVREWDLPKLQQDKESTGNERQVIEETSAPDQQQTAKQTEKPSKTLDDYFRKTKAKPPIYWLPLTEEQATERAQRRAQRKAEREEEERKRQRDENSRTASDNHDSKTRSNNPSYGSSNRPYRRSPSPRDKRRRVSSSRSPSNSRRDNKRH